MKKKHSGLHTLLALLFASILGLSMVACEEDEGIGDDIEDAAEEIEDGIEDAAD